VLVGSLGSGSDYTPFLQHFAVPSTDIESRGPYGVYHSVFDNYAWFLKNADPTFIYLREMAQIFGLEVLHMADAPVLPYDYVTYGKEIMAYLDTAKDKAAVEKLNKLDFVPVQMAAEQFLKAAEVVHQKQLSSGADSESFNRILRQVESDFLLPSGLPERPWYRHAIFAPGEYTGYAAVVIPGVNEAISDKNESRAQEQLAQLTQALHRATSTLKATH
jgi:N-acetylated-alpha-linked acidic dipeptidase